MRHIIAILVCFIAVMCTITFRFITTENIVSGYANAVEILGKTQLTSKWNLLGERFDKRDDFTGSYKCSADRITGRDVPYGGCRIHDTKLRVKGTIHSQSGAADVRIGLGSSVETIKPDKKGNFDRQFEFSGSNYVMVQYKNFTGSVDIKTEYV